MSFVQSIISEDIASNIGWTLLHSIWQGALLSVILLVLLNLLRKRNPGLRYGISLVFYFGFIVWTVAAYALRAGTPEQLIYNSTLNLSMVPKIQEPGMMDFGPIHVIRNLLLSLAEKSGLYISKYGTMLTLIWILGVIVFGLRLSGGLLFARYSIFNNRKESSPQLQEIVKKLQKRMKIGTVLRCFESARIKIPLVFGSIKPILLVPVGMLSGIPANQVEAIIAHELAHIKRYDFIVNILQSIVEVIFFYHPAIWWMSSVLRRERENCCDDLAIKYSSGEITYVKALSSIQSIQSKNYRVMVAFSNNKDRLLSRINRLVNPDSVRHKSPFLPMVLGLVLLTTLALKPGMVVEPGHQPLAIENSNTAALWSMDLISPEIFIIPADTVKNKKLKKKEEAEKAKDEDLKIDKAEKEAMADQEIDFYFDHESFAQNFDYAIDNLQIHFPDSFHFDFKFDEFHDIWQDAMEDIHMEMEDFHFDTEDFFFQDSINVDWEKIRKEMDKVRIEMEQFRSEEFQKEMESMKASIKEHMKDLKVEMERFQEEEMPRLKKEMQQFMKEHKELLEEHKKELEKSKKDSTLVKPKKL